MNACFHHSKEKIKKTTPKNGIAVISNLESFGKVHGQL